MINHPNRKQFCFAVIQHGGPIYGVGKTVEDAREDAREWLPDTSPNEIDNIDDYADLGGLRRVGGNPLGIVPCTVALARAVKKAGGQIPYAENEQGWLCLESEAE